MQQRLTALGLYKDKVDGKAGMLTRAALGAYQKANGLKLDCWPTAAVLDHMRRLKSETPGIAAGRLFFVKGAPCQAQILLRADEARLAIADNVAVAVTQRPAGPEAAGAAHRIGLGIALINNVAGRRRVVARLAVGNGRAEQGAADHRAANPAAGATGFRRSGGGQGTGSDGRNCRES